VNKNFARLSAPARPALPKIAAIFITGLLLAAGCSKSDAPTKTGAPAKTAEAPTPPVIQEALKLAAKLAQDHWVIQEDGALWFGHAGNQMTFMTKDVQFKPATPKVVAEDITEADRLNGVEWHGAVNFSAPAHRVRMDGNPWADWEPWPQGTFWSVELEKRNGNWTADEQMLLVGRSGGGPGQVEIGYYSLKSSKPVTEGK
jgi:hypothetical protein